MVEFGICPKCGNGKIVEGENTYKCVNRNSEEGCQFLIFKEMYGITLERESLIEILESGAEGVKIDNLQSKEGTIYSATLIYNKETNRIYSEYIEESLNSSCPACEGKVIVTSKTYSCENSRQDIPEEERCNVYIMKTIAQREISHEEAEILFSGQKTNKLNGFINKKGEKFSAILYIDENTMSTKFEYEEIECPNCKAKIIERDTVFSCTGWKENKCGFSLFKSSYGGTWNEKDLKDLIENGKTKAKTLKTKGGKEYKGSLYFNKKLNKMEILD